MLVVDYMNLEFSGELGIWVVYLEFIIVDMVFKEIGGGNLFRE